MLTASELNKLRSEVSDLWGNFVKLDLFSTNDEKFNQDLSNYKSILLDLLRQLNTVYTKCEQEFRNDNY